MMMMMKMMMMMMLMMMMTMMMMMMLMVMMMVKMMMMMMQKMMPHSLGNKRKDIRTCVPMFSMIEQHDRLHSLEFVCSVAPVRQSSFNLKGLANT